MSTPFLRFFFARARPRLERYWHAAPSYAVGLIQLACALHLIDEYVGGFRMVKGPSMLPTMSADGELVLELRTPSWPTIRAFFTPHPTDRLSSRPAISPSPYQRGDLVVATSPHNPAHLICKRVLGLPGDVICVDPTGEYAPSTEHVVIPDGHVWLVGDNAKWSRDSRTYGPVSMALIRGRVVARVWPWRSRTIFRVPTSYIDGQ